MIVTDEIHRVLDTIQTLNLNQCAATTYDMSIQECVRREITLALARHYNIEYKIPYPVSKGLFPVKSTSRG